MAARSDSAAASARCPASAAVTRGWSRRKCTPSTIASTLVTASGRARTTAASSPTQRTMRGERGRMSCSNAAMSERSPTGAPLPVAIDDAGAIEVVGRQLDAHAVAGQDADAEAAHLARDVPEHRVAVVELDAEHGVGQRLDHLALELDLLLLGHGARDATQPFGLAPPLFGPVPPALGGLPLGSVCGGDS